MPNLHSIESIVSIIVSIESLENALLKTGWNKARVRLLARFLIALLVCRTVCLYRLANVFPGEVQTGSHYKRLQRFLSGFDLDFATLARLMVAWSGQKAPFILALDRTNWKFGKAELNILVLALVYNGVAFPLFWKVLGKAGNSPLSTRVALLEQYLCVFGQESIAYLCADREFGGQAFAAWLLERKIPFVLRLRGNTRLTNAKGVKKSAKGLFWHGKVLVLAWQSTCFGMAKYLFWHGKVQVAQHLGKRDVFGKSLPLFVSGMRIKGGDFVIVISDTGEDLLERYARRWGIETLFGCLKRRGFNMEATHLTESERLSRLLGVLSLAFCWAYVSGLWLFEQKPWKVKKHGRLMISLFRRGLDWLQRILLPLCGNKSQQDFNQAIQFLSCT